MQREEIEAFVVDWVQAFNRRDLDAVLTHFDECVRFTSPRAVAVVGVPTVEGKAALRHYWSQALARVRTLKFTLDHTLWDADRWELVIVYVAERDGRRQRVCERLRLNHAGRAVEGEVTLGVEL
jgi:hypothetical protein